MGILDDLITINANGDIKYANWVEWEHFLIPNSPEEEREIRRELMALLGHCLNCTSLDGCYFLDTNKPEQPLHKNCDCKKKNISYSEVKGKASSECAIQKFTEYVLKNNEISGGKNKIFLDMGYSINDSEYLQNEFCKQALEQYKCGSYKLKNLDRRGQRLAIPIKLKGKQFYSGWLLCPEGKIKNTTPFGGWIK